jgi:hypothetical protein
MQEKIHTKFDDFTFIVKTPGESKCQLIKKDALLVHSKSVNYFETFEEFNGGLFCSSLDPNFDEIVKLYKGPVSFECIAIDRPDVTYRSLEWLKEEMLKEFSTRFPEDTFYDLYFI